jgi:predicted transcriptional regulator
MNTEQARQDQLYRAARYITPAVRADLTAQLVAMHGLAPDVADAVLRTCIEAILDTTPRKYATFATRDARNAKVLGMAKEGFCNADIADALGVTTARVCQILAELRAAGNELPARKKGPRSTRLADAMAAAPLFHAELTVPEIAQRLTLPEAAVGRLYSLLEQHGEKLPPLRRRKETLDEARDAYHTALSEYEAEEEFGGERLEELKTRLRSAARRYKAMRDEAMPNEK